MATITGSGAVTLPSLSASGDGEWIPLSPYYIQERDEDYIFQRDGDPISLRSVQYGSVSLPMLQVSGGGTIARFGSGAITLPAIQLSGSDQSAGRLISPLLGEASTNAFVLDNTGQNAMTLDGDRERVLDLDGSTNRLDLDSDGGGDLELSDAYNQIELER